jgi:hypothetical protein
MGTRGTEEATATSEGSKLLLARTDTRAALRTALCRRTGALPDAAVQETPAMVVGLA